MAEKLVVKNLVKKYGDFTAVRGISFDVKEGEVVALLGPSGCGKTTTLKCVAGLEEVTAGEIYLNGEPITDLEPWQRNIAMVFQFFVMYPRLKVYDQIAFPLQARGLPKEEIRRRVMKAIEIVRLPEELLEKSVQALKMDERQRVAIARSLVREPTLLLLDEPLSNLEPKMRIALRGEFKRLFDELNLSVLYVTHDQAEAMVLADRIAVMNAGEIYQFADKKTVYERPANLFVAGFIGSPPMNLLPAIVRKIDSELYIDCKEFKARFPLIPTKIIDRILEKEIILGFRPEHVRVGKTLNQDSLVIEQCKISFIEQLGSKIILHLSKGEYSLIAISRALSSPIKEGKEIDMFIEPEHLHLFDKKTGKALI